MSVTVQRDRVALIAEHPAPVDVEAPLRRLAGKQALMLTVLAVGRAITGFLALR